LAHADHAGIKDAINRKPAVIARRIFLVFILAAFSTPAPAQVSRGPEAIVKSLYESTKKDPMRPGFGVTKADRRLLTASLRTLWDKAEKKANPTGKELGAIDFDIVSMSQDSNIASYTIATEKRDEQRATIVATYVIGPNHTHTGEKIVVNYDFLREGGAWKIDNARSTIEGKPWTLRENLEMHLKN
jgi:hypothetical protein